MTEPHQTQISINACSQCRRLHKKCDKSLPSCLRCTKRHKKCNYETVGKRGPKTQSEYTQPYPQFTIHKSVAAPAENNPEFQYSTKSDFRIPTNMLTQFPLLKLHTVMSPDSMFRCFAYLEHIWNGTPFDGETPSEIELALIYSLQACVHSRNDEKERGKAFFEKAKALTMAQFDCVLTNVPLTVCFVFLGAYCVLSDDINRALFFLDNVKSYLNRNKDVNEKGFDFVSNAYYSMERVIIGDMDMERAMKNALAQHTYMRDYFKSEAGIEYCKNLPSGVMRVLVDTDLADKDIDKIQYDLQNNTNTYVLDGDRLAFLSTKLFSMMERLQGVIPDHILHMKRYQTTYTLQGLQLQRCMRLGYYDIAKGLADGIAYMTCSPAFEKNYHTSAPVIMLAAKAHLELLPMMKDDRLRSEVINCLIIELKAMLLIQEKNSIIGARCTDVIDQLTSALRAEQERTLLQNVFFTPAQATMPTTVPFLEEFFADFNNDTSQSSDSSSELVLAGCDDANALLNFETIDKLLEDFAEFS